MKKKEALEFLELPENASDMDISQRIADKLNYFERLTENAPNEFLKKLHLQNIEKVKTISSFLLQETSPSRNHQQNNYVETPYQPKHSSSAPVAPSGSPVAFLIRHTENLSSKTFPLFSGKNFIGRLPDASANTIVIDDDAFVSRQHAVIEVNRGHNHTLIIVSDDSSQGKPSKNGTYVNGNQNRINQRVEIRENDTVQIGMTKLILRYNNTSINKIVHEVEESDFMKTVIIDIF